MTKQDYTIIENYMLTHITDSAHDKHHIYRVLNAAVDIASHEQGIDMGVLVAACLLHDIGRSVQMANPAVCHAKAGGQMAFDFFTSHNLLSQKWHPRQARHVQDCISTHRYRGDSPPQTIEAKILFDADKLEAAGVIGIARTLIFSGHIDGPLYTLNEGGRIITGTADVDTGTFFQHYNHKLKNVYDSFYTARAKEIAQKRKNAAENFYNALYAEVTDNIKSGTQLTEVIK
ncbi:MAG: HD domain-containing protein [Firmicutes bacterium]|nr:HD domain-containing protein [Bacillota bacterium]